MHQRRGVENDPAMVDIDLRRHLEIEVVMSHRQRASPRRAMAVIAVIILLIVLALIIAGMVLGTARDHDLTHVRLNSVRSFYAAEAGVNMSIRELVNNADEDGDGTIGTISDDADDNTDPSIGQARVNVTQTLGPVLTTLSSQGRAGGARRSIDTELR
ncbi:MAG: hypothetical protein GY715_11290 [Planctomycetes bacterium]|nr:hypothetical protein [Planctomycetota bacterium]